MRARIPVPQSRRGLLVAAVALALVLGGAVAGIIVATSSSSDSSKTATDGGPLAGASFPGFQLSFRYPAAWHRRDWCWFGTSVSPVTLLTTARLVPSCHTATLFGIQTPLPPPQGLGKDGVTVWWQTSVKPGLDGATPNARLGGRPAHITLKSEPVHHSSSGVQCVGTGATQRSLTALIRGPSSQIARVRVGAVICGPDFASGVADVRAMLDSLTFTS